MNILVRGCANTSEHLCSRSLFRLSGPTALVSFSAKKEAHTFTSLMVSEVKITLTTIGYLGGGLVGCGTAIFEGKFFEKGPLCSMLWWMHLFFWERSGMMVSDDSP